MKLHSVHFHQVTPETLAGGRQASQMGNAGRQQYEPRWTLKKRTLKGAMGKVCPPGSLWTPKGFWVGYGQSFKPVYEREKAPRCGNSILPVMGTIAGNETQNSTHARYIHYHRDTPPSHVSYQTPTDKALGILALSLCAHLLPIN